MVVIFLVLGKKFVVSCYDYYMGSIIGYLRGGEGRGEKSVLVWGNIILICLFD